MSWYFTFRTMLLNWRPSTTEISAHSISVDETHLLTLYLSSDIISPNFSVRANDYMLAWLRIWKFWESWPPSRGGSTFLFGYILFLCTPNGKWVHTWRLTFPKIPNFELRYSMDYPGQDLMLIARFFLRFFDERYAWMANCKYQENSGPRQYLTSTGLQNLNGLFFLQQINENPW